MASNGAIGMCLFRMGGIAVVAAVEKSNGCVGLAVVRHGASID